MRLLLTQLDADPSDGLDNLGHVQGLLPADVTGDDVLLLPELIGGEVGRTTYETALQRFAARIGCHVVGGSYHSADGPEQTNGGVVVAPTGDVVDRYGKHRPYGAEHGTVARDRTTGAGRFRVQGREVVVIVCADFWFSELLHGLAIEPDVLHVPAFSISQKPTPDHARALWSHMTASRAYEFSTFVGLSDWAHPVAWGGLAASGVAGFADPNPGLESRHFRPAHPAGVTIVDPDFDRLDELRTNRTERGFEPERSSSTDRLQGAT
ncbi:MAG: nitrilase-related carbon-nitrogen hydrolase [Actinomycetota bacterium]